MERLIHANLQVIELLAVILEEVERREGAVGRPQGGTDPAREPPAATRSIAPSRAQG